MLITSYIILVTLESKGFESISTAVLLSTIVSFVSVVNRSVKEHESSVSKQWQHLELRCCPLRQAHVNGYYLLRWGFRFIDIIATFWLYALLWIQFGGVFLLVLIGFQLIIISTVSISICLNLIPFASVNYSYIIETPVSNHAPHILVLAWILKQLIVGFLVSMTYFIGENFVMLEYEVGWFVVAYFIIIVCYNMYTMHIIVGYGEETLLQASDNVLVNNVEQRSIEACKTVEELKQLVDFGYKLLKKDIIDYTLWKHIEDPLALLQYYLSYKFGVYGIMIESEEFECAWNGIFTNPVLSEKSTKYWHGLFTKGNLVTCINGTASNDSSNEKKNKKLIKG